MESRPRWRLKARTAWRQKLEKDQPPKVVPIPPKMQRRFGTGTILVPRPLDVDALIRKVPKGKLITQQQIREKLASDHKADTTCPITAGIFVRIAAEAAEEDRRDGKKRITPYWRVLTHDGRLNPKFPGGVRAQARHLRAEGHAIVAGKGKKSPQVKEFEDRLARL